MLYYFRYAVKIEKKQKSVSKLSFVPALDGYALNVGTKGEFDTSPYVRCYLYPGLFLFPAEFVQYLFLE
jgi:hypothetical protein